jgi:hypothetical protein
MLNPRRKGNGRASSFRLIIPSFFLAALGANTASAIYVEDVDYLPVPEAAQPLEGLLPKKGVESSQGRGYLQVNSQFLKRRHNVNFETREVEIVSYLGLPVPGSALAAPTADGPPPPSAGGGDSTTLWAAYYRELNSYNVDMQELALRRLWLNEFIGKEDASTAGGPGMLDIVLPVNVPDWMKRIGVDKPRLRINGSYKLVVEGSRRSGSGVPDGGDSWFPDLHMDQQPAFSVKGSIGRLINIEINSEEGFGTNLKEQLKITYKGEGDELEDDIIQEIEAGNTSLALTGTALTGYTESHKGLFGLKMRMKFGGLEVTTIASQEGGSQESQKLGLGTSVSEFTIEDRGMDLHRHFFLNLRDREDYRKPANWNGTDPNYYKLGRGRRPVEAFQLLLTGEEINFKDTATACPYDIQGNRLDPLCETGRWKSLKEGADYYYDEQLRMLTVPGGHRNMSVAVRWLGDPVPLKNGARDSRQLVLVHSRVTVGAPELDSLMWRNVYNIGKVNSQDRDNFRVRTVNKDSSERNQGDTLTFTRKLGLEKPDKPGQVWVDNQNIFNFDQGYMVLPCQGGIDTADDRRNCLTPLKRVNPDTKVYSDPVDEIQNGPTTHRFVVTGRQRKSTFDVRETSHSVSGSQCLDITPGTEKLVRNGSETLQRNVDYEVLYETGQITLISPRAKDPNADIAISYECTPPFQIQDKILLGTRLEYKLDGISDESMLGATLLYKSQTTTQERPDLGREPFNQFLWGFNARLAGTPKWMTKLVNTVPFVQTEAASRANFEFEVAQSRYNPNTKESAYIDNFESSENILPMPMFIYQWFKASPPEFGFDGRPDETLDYRHQGLLIWHSSVKEAYARIYGSTGNSYTNSREQTLLKLTLQPNDNLEGHSWGGVMRSLSQGLFNQSKKRILEVVVQGHEGDLNIDLGQISEDISIPGLNGAKPDGRLESEIDVNRGEVLNSNDKFGLDGFNKETGEKGVRWECKPTCYAISTAVKNNEDPGLDNYSAPQGGTEEFASVNGTEGNNNATGGYAYDTEDLDRSGVLDAKNQYLRYVMPLDSACEGRFHCEELRNGWRKYQIPLYGSGGKIGAVGGEGETQILSTVKMMRVWVGRLPPRVTKSEVLIARINLIGNSWEEGDRSKDFEIDADRFASGDLPDSLAVRVPPSTPDSNRLKVEVVNKQEDKAYQPSPNTKIERDTRTDEPLPERSLVLHYENLHPGEAVHATRLLGSDPKDLTLYDRIRMEIHPDSEWVKESATYRAGQNKVSLGLRLGKDRGDRDSRDYYEIRLHMDTSLTSTGEAHRALWERNSFDVRITDLTGLKNDPLYLTFPGRPVSANVWNEGRADSSLTISVVGNPTLSKIDWMRLVVYVDSGAVESQRGDIWIDDLRLEGVDKSLGTSMRTQLQLDFSDFVSVSGNLTYRNGNFTTMSETKTTPANSQSTVDYNAAVSLFANKFFPDQWGVSLPISVQHHGNISRPFTKPTSDLTLTGTDFMDIARDALDGDIMTPDSNGDIQARRSRVYQSTTFEEKFSIFYKKEHRSENYLNQIFFERPDIQYSFSSQDHNEYFSQNDSRNYSTKLMYSLSPFTNPSHKVLGFTDKWKYMPKFLSDMDLTPFPEKLNLTVGDLSFVRTHTFNKPRSEFDVPLNLPPQYNVELTHGLDLEWRLLSFFGFGYRIAVNRDFDPERECFDRETFLGGESEAGDGIDCGILAHNLVFSLDDEDFHPGHHGDEFGILARERNRTQSFHMDLNPNFSSFLTLGANYNANYRHTRNDSTLDRFNALTKPEFFEANADHDVKLNASLSLPALLGTPAEKSFFGIVKKKMDDWRLRNLDASYSVSHKYNNEQFTYDFLDDRETHISPAALAAYQLGFVYDSPAGFFQDFFDGEPDPYFLDYLSQPDTRLGEPAFNHEVGRSWDASSGFTVPWVDLGISMNLKYSKQYALYRRLQASDTSVVWPEYTLSGTFNDFANRLAFLRKTFRSMTATTTYNYREEDRRSLFARGRESHKVSQKFDPLMRLSATTNKDVRGELSLKLGRDVVTNYDKVPGENANMKYYGGTNGDTLQPTYVRVDSLATPEEAFNVGGDLSIQWDLETQKGIQFWRYYIKLQNNLRLKVASGINYSYTERRPPGEDARKEPEILSASLKPELSYNFTNNVDALFFLLYKYDKLFHTAREETTHEVQIHGEFTMRF